MTLPTPGGQPEVVLTDTFDIWRQKTNQLSANLGDVDLFIPVIEITSDNCVDAIIEAFAAIDALERAILAKAWFMN